MKKLIKIVEKILKSKAGIIPAFIYDENRLYEEIFNNLNKYLEIIILNNNSQALLRKQIRNSGTNEICAIYSTFKIDVDAYIASQKLRPIIITPNLLFSYCDETKTKTIEKIKLTDEQYKILINNFDTIISDIKNNELINNKILINSLAKVFMGKMNTPKDLMISFIKGDFSIDNVESLHLYDEIINIIKYNYNINISKIKNNENLFEKVLITLHVSQKHTDFEFSVDKYIIYIDAQDLNNIFEFIKINVHAFEKEILEINNKFKNIIINKNSYIIPILFENYISNNIQNYYNIKINNNLLWTTTMQSIGLFINKISYLDDLVNQYISYTFDTNSISSVIKEYKEYLYEIDSTYRELLTLYEELSYNFKFYIKIKNSNIMEKIELKYFNVIRNINGKYIENYNNLIDDTSKVLRQDEFFKKIKFKKNTVFIFADGLRYEMIKKLISHIKYNEIIDYDVFSLLPTETEVCMNSYFITDEKLKINSKNIFKLLTKNNKLITHIIEWRIKKLSQLLKCNVISFEDFKENINYDESVICFYNDIDKAMHSYNSSQKISLSLVELKSIITYSINRNFDVMILSDHGFIDVKEKINVQNNDLNVQKKKSRYLILESNKRIDFMFYKNDLKVAKFIDLQNKNICFINSINSLRKTSRYTHGGISLQENIITAILFKV